MAQGTPPYDPYGFYATPPHSEELCEHFILELSKVFLPYAGGGDQEPVVR
jgi:hypothetical protein